MIKFCKDGNLFFDGDKINLSEINAEEFFIANLSMPIELENGIKLETIMSNFSNIRKFIYNYYADYYDRLKPLIESRDIDYKYSQLNIVKKLLVENDYVYMQVGIDLKEELSTFKFLSEIPVFLNEELSIIQESSKIKTEGILKIKITLQDLLDALFDDLIHMLTDGFIE
jgi:hypothetical protein